MRTTLLGTVKASALGAAVALALVGGAHAAPNSISNGTISAVFNDSGTFASLSYTATEFVNWGTALSCYWLNSSAVTFTANNATSSNPLGALTFGVGGFAFTGNEGRLTFQQ